MRFCILILITFLFSGFVHSQDNDYLPGTLILLDGTLIEGNISWKDHDVFVRHNGIEEAFFTEEVKYFEVNDPAYKEPRRFYSLLEDPEHDRQYILFEVSGESNLQAILFKKEIVEVKISEVPPHLYKGKYASNQARRIYGTRTEKVNRYTFFYSTPQLYPTPFLVSQNGKRDQVKVIDRGVLNRFSGLSLKEFFSKAVDEEQDLNNHEELNHFLSSLISSPQVRSN